MTGKLALIPESAVRAVITRQLAFDKVSTRSTSRAEWLTGQLEDIDTEFRFTSAEEALRGSDIVVTVTPSKEPLVAVAWIAEGVHVSAMGVDAQGKNELDTAILKRARLFAEYPEQSVAIGEFQHARRDGVIGSADDVCALGLVTLGESPGRTSESEVTVFDSSGIAIQDLAVASAVYQAATAQDFVEFIEF